MNVIVYDYETYWDAQYTLSKMSAIEYVRDARFYAQLLGVSINGAPARVHTHDEIPSVLKSLELDNPTNILIGHNASGFDNLITDEVYGIKPSCVLTDTMHMARWSGLSRVCRETLHDLCEMLGLGVKQAGTEWSKGKRTPDEFEQEEWEKFKAYCAMDVTLTARLVTKLLPYMTTDAIKFSSITCKMATHPAFYVDVPILQSYLMELKQKEAEAKESLKTLLGVTDDIDFKKQIRSAAKFESMLKILNVEVPMKLSEKKTATAKQKLEEEYTTATPARAAEISAMLADKESYAVYTPAFAKTDLEFVALQDHPDPQVQELVRLRLENNSSMPETRTKALLRMGNTRPVPILLKCFYAHTSRYGAGNTEGKSDSLNWQNFSKRMPNMKTIRQAIIPPAGYVVVACDSSQIEARVLAYVACQEDLLEQFAQHRDPYAELAAKFKPGLTAEEIHNGAKAGDKDCKLLRNAGKRAVLSCWEADTEVLTDTGWKCISNVSLTDKLWDGIEWVQHKGLISNGKKPVINFCGTSVTPNHMIYDGTSWRTAAVFLSKPYYWKLAQKYATDLYKMSQSKRTVQAVTLSCTKSSANTVATNTGCLLNVGIWCLKNIALIVSRHILQERRVKFTPTLKSVQKLVRLLCLKMGTWIGAVPTVRPIENGQYLFNVPAGQNRIGLVSLTYIQGRRRAVMRVQKRKQVKHNRKNIMLTRGYAQILSTGAGYLIELQRKLTDAIIRMMHSIIDTAGGVSRLILKVVPMRSHTMCLCPVGITPNCRLIESTTAKVMGRVTCDSLLSTKTPVINALSKSLLRSWQKVKKNVLNLNTLSQTLKSNLQKVKKNAVNSNSQSLLLKNVYDVYDAGPRHRYTVRTKDGSIFLAHNCGYGASASRYAESIWKDGVHLADSKEEHDRLAAPLHAIYRQTNYNITNFWKTCTHVLNALLTKQKGYFGGPTNKLFIYGEFKLPNGELCPSIVLPSGYMLRYPNLRVGSDGRTVVYDRRLGKNIVETRIYGGACTENLIQSLAFQILMWQAVRMSEVGIRLHCNIHDSFATVVPEAQAEETKECMLKIMRMVPPWVEGLPLDAEAEIGHDFTIV